MSTGASTSLVLSSSPPPSRPSYHDSSDESNSVNKNRTLGVFDTSFKIRVQSLKHESLFEDSDCVSLSASIKSAQSLSASHVFNDCTTTCTTPPKSTDRLSATASSSLSLRPFIRRLSTGDLNDSHEVQHVLDPSCEERKENKSSEFVDVPKPSVRASRKSSVSAKAAATVKAGRDLLRWEPSKVKKLFSRRGRDNDSAAEFCRSCLNKEEIKKKGWLYKLGKVRRSWKKRWCILTIHTLFYFESQSHVTMGRWKGFVSLMDANRADVVPYATLRKENCFRLSTSTRQWIFQASSVFLMSDWIECLRDLLGENVRASLASQDRVSIRGYKTDIILGTGAFSQVLLGVHGSSGERVAVKVVHKSELDADMIERVMRELTLLQNLKHPNVIPLLDFEDTEFSLCLVLRYVDGQTLDDLVAEEGTHGLSDSSSCSIFRQLSDAVGYCHKEGVCHRDLKMENILVEAECNGHHVWLIDFGLARVLPPKDASGAAQFLNTYCGTYEYAAPEMINKRKYTGPPSDVWSLGVILYVITTGSFPFQAETRNTTKLKRLISKGISAMEFPLTMSIDLENLIKSILVANPDKRPTVAQILDSPWLLRTSVSAPTLTPSICFKAASSERINDSLAGSISSNNHFNSRSSGGLDTGEYKEWEFLWDSVASSMPSESGFEDKDKDYVSCLLSSEFSDDDIAKNSLPTHISTSNCDQEDLSVTNALNIGEPDVPAVPEVSSPADLSNLGISDLMDPLFFAQMRDKHRME